MVLSQIKRARRRTGAEMTINISHLWWIVPTTAMVSAAFIWMIRGFIESSKRDDEVREQIMRDEQAKWRGGWGRNENVPH